VRLALAVLTISAVLASGMHDKTAGRPVEPDTPQRWLVVGQDRGEASGARLLTKEGLEDWENGIKDNCKILASEVKDKVAEKTRTSGKEVSIARQKFEAAARLILKETASRARQIEAQMQALEVATAHGLFNGKTSVTPLGKCCCAGKSEDDAECSWHTHSELVGSLDKFQCPPEAVFEYTDLVKPTFKNSTNFVDARSIDQLLGACVRSPRWQERMRSSGQADGNFPVDAASAGALHFATVTDPEAQKVTDIIARSLSPLTGGTDAWVSEGDEKPPYGQDGPQDAFHDGGIIQQDRLPMPEHEEVHVPIRIDPVPNHQEDELSSVHDGEGEQVASDSDTDSRGDSATSHAGDSSWSQGPKCNPASVKRYCLTVMRYVTTNFTADDGAMYLAKGLNSGKWGAVACAISVGEVQQICASGGSGSASSTENDSDDRSGSEDTRGGGSPSSTENDSDDRSGSEDTRGGGSPSSSDPDSDDDSSSNSGTRSQDEEDVKQGRPQSGLPGPGGSQQGRPHSGGSNVHPNDAADLERELAMSDDSEDENQHPRSGSNAQSKQWGSITVKLSIKPGGHNESSFSQAAATLTSKAAVLRPARSRSHEA